MKDPVPTIITCGPFRIRVYYYRDNDGKTSWRSEISGCYQSGDFDTEKKAKQHIVNQGLEAIQPLVQELEKIHAKSKSRS